MLLAWVPASSTLGACLQASLSHEVPPAASRSRDGTGSNGRWVSYHACLGLIRDTNRATAASNPVMPRGVLLESDNLGLLPRLYLLILLEI